MRRRAKRELSIIVGIAFMLCGVVLLNSYLRRSDLKEKMVAWREKIESERQDKGIELLDWELLRKTTGNFRKGPTFDTRLSAIEGSTVNLIGFMTPLEQFRDITEFILLPMPIECYFCEEPPLRDVVLVQMAANHPTNLYREPTLINGTLELQYGQNTKFFYIIREAGLGPAEVGGQLHEKEVPLEHRVGTHVRQMEQEKLLPPAEPPKAVPLPPGTGAP